MKLSMYLRDSPTQRKQSPAHSTTGKVLLLPTVSVCITADKSLSFFYSHENWRSLMKVHVSPLPGFSSRCAFAGPSHDHSPFVHFTPCPRHQALIDAPEASHPYWKIICKHVFALTNLPQRHSILVYAPKKNQHRLSTCLLLLGILSR